MVHHVELRYRNTTGNRHFLDDIAQFAFFRVAGVRINSPGTNHSRHARAASGEVHPAYQGAEANQRDHRTGGCQAMAGQ